jgi:hypothetical protein
MNKLAGIISTYPFTKVKIAEGQIKRNLLLFDKLGILRLTQAIQKIREHHPNHNCEVRKFGDELELLVEQGFLFEGDIGSSAPVKQKDSTPQNIKTFYQLLDAEKSIRTHQDVPDQIKIDAYIRLKTFVLNIADKPKDFYAVPVVSQLSLPIEYQAEKSDVFNIVIDKFPIPSDSVTWHQILEFKSNPDNTGRLHGLKDAINKLSKSNNTIEEINDEIEYNLYQYSKSMKAINLKYNLGKLETFVVRTGELFENVAKLQFSDIAKMFFSAKNSKADLLAAELNSPGHHLSYIYKAKAEFDK